MSSHSTPPRQLPTTTPAHTASEQGELQDRGTFLQEDRENILSIIELLCQYPEIQEICYSPGTIKVSRFPGTPQANSLVGPAVVAAAPKQEEAPAGLGQPIQSPMVGTAYLAPKPDALPFITVGDTVEKGQVLLIIEAMKLLNPIKSPVSGKVTKICATNAVPVEYDEVLVYIQPH